MSVAPTNGRCIIEEWQNPPKCTKEFSQNDRRYEERAVDVVMDDPHGIPKRVTRDASQTKLLANDDPRMSNDEKLIKMRKSPGSGTVTSIPIKDYQASIAHNIGTLRRSTAPQSQFESLVSEPEKIVYVPLKKRMPLGGLHQRNVSQSTMQVEAARRQSLCRFCNGQHDYCNGNSTGNAVNDRYFHRTSEQGSRDGSDIGEYFRKNSRGRFGTSDFGRSARDTRDVLRADPTGMTVIVTDNIMGERTKAKGCTKALQLAEGHVGEKVSAYEENVRRSARGGTSPLGTRYRSAFEHLKGHRNIGIPLVGMHNACGLPVVASWHDHELLEPLRISRGMVATMGPLYRSPRVISNVRRLTQPKRKVSRRSMDRTGKNSTERNVKRSTVKSMTRLDSINGGNSRKRHPRRSSFTATKVGSLSSKKNSFKKAGRPKKYCGIKTSSLIDTLSRRSLKRGSAKRATLYAKDDGDEAVQVLKSLCLNPLARTNPEADMMW